MNAQQIADRIVNKNGSYKEIMSYAEGMIAPLIERAEAAEAERDELRRQLEQAQARITELETYIDKHNKKALAFIDDALNSGDGVYRP